MGDRRPSRGRWTLHALAALVVAACVLVYLWPVLVGGKVLSPAALLYGYPPWLAIAPHGSERFANWVLFDLPVVDYPWRFLARSFIREGTFPAWNPYALSGIPFYTNPQTGLFSPFNLPLWILPLDYGLGLSAALKLFVGGFGTYLLARQLRLSFFPGVLAGIAFAFSAINIVWLAHETLPGVVVMAPWAIWLVERIFERARLGSAIALAGVIAVGLSGGHPGMQVHLLVVVSAYTLLRAACTPRTSRAALAQRLALVFAGLGAGVLLMAFMLIPEVRGSRDTLAVLARRNGQLPGAHMPFKVAASTLFPQWWGHPGGVEAPTTAANADVLGANFCERTFYAGTVALVLAGVALASRDRWRRTLPFALVGLGALAVALRAPGLIVLATHLPVVGSVGVHRLHFAFELAVAVLAAFGLQEIIDAPADLRRRLVVVVAACIVALLAVTQIHARRIQVVHTLEHFVTGKDYVAGAVLALTSVIWFLLFVLAVGALLWVVARRPAWRTGVAATLVVLAAVDAQHFVHGFQPMGPRSLVVLRRPPAIAYLQRHRDEGRVVGLGNALPPDTGLVYGLRDVRGYDPPQPTRRMLRLWRLANPPLVPWGPMSLSELGVPQLHVLGVLGARYIVAGPGTPVDSREAGVLSTVYDGRDARVLAYARTPPRVFVPATLRITSSWPATGRTIAEAGFNPRTQVAVERDQPGVAALADGPQARGTVAIASERNAGVTLQAQLDRRALVVLNDQLLDGWRVMVDGRPATPLYVNGVMRGVVAPAGRHRIVWDYTVPGLRVGAALSATTLALLVAGALACGVRARRPRRRSSREQRVPMLKA